MWFPALPGPDSTARYTCGPFVETGQCGLDCDRSIRSLWSGPSGGPRRERPLEVATPPVGAPNRTSRSRMPRGTLTGSGRRGTFLLGLESGCRRGRTGFPGPDPPPYPSLSARNLCHAVGTLEGQQVCARHLAPFSQEGKAATPSGRASGWGRSAWERWALSR